MLKFLSDSEQEHSSFCYKDMEMAPSNKWYARQVFTEQAITITQRDYEK